MSSARIIWRWFNSHAVDDLPDKEPGDASKRHVTAMNTSAAP